MRRPSFQFYPADWSANPNLKRCTFAERGVWLEVMCLMHDQDQYGVIRWSLKEIAHAVGCKVANLQALARKGVLKGSDNHLTEAFVYVPRSGRKDGTPVTLIDTQAGPIWFSSRMVRDEHVRIMRSEGQDNGEAPKAAPKGAPKPPIGEAFGPRGSSSSSSASSKTVSKASPSHPPCGGERFTDFWLAWPRSERRQDKAECLKRWKAKGLDAIADEILADVRTKRGTTKWSEGYIEAPLVYLNNRRWEDGVVPDEPADAGGLKWHETRQGVEAKGVELGLGKWDEAAWSINGFKHADSFMAYERRVLEAAGIAGNLLRAA